ncbi:alkaline-phosphatase-like protein [Polychytrium aggregatum]|uniref:alkaline-phosphatase-like protein n=1 Tax=Polychytrium aggregatum TaxID=110093 RepID=UPI0022FE9CB3|nr:alkaline-phosphatase-like protein [Polychytrium aggregatum]KAI9199281.1 alkaline-phosphatase-like protein [Polychytrium aggregatum]
MKSTIFLAFPALLAAATSLVAAEQQKPNFILFLTDDQDLHYDSLNYLPNIQKTLLQQGTEFTRYYTTTATCCPSRVSLWSGKFAHNHNVTDESPPHGSYTKFISQKVDDSYLPLWLQNAGYRNHYIGKFINGVSTTLHQAPKGWDHWEPLVAPNIYLFNDPIFSLNNGPLERLTGQYQTDVISNKSIALIDQLAANSTQPFLFVISPTAPHQEVYITPNGTIFTPPVPAERHRNLFNDVKVPRRPNFNPAVQDKVSWVQNLPLLTDQQIDDLDELYRNRLRSLQATDELVARVIDRLEANGQLDNTYLIYTTDNGYHLGAHRLYAGKQTPYEEDINIPFIIRGPGVAKNQQRDAVSTHTHFAATVLRLAGLPIPDDLDAASIPVLESDYTHHDKCGPTFADLHSPEAFDVEFWSDAFIENSTYVVPPHTNAYKSVRLHGKDYDLLYSTWCTGEHEFYDMRKDPYQLTNAFNQTSPQLLNRLDALLNVLRTCKGKTCRQPWSAIQPSADPPVRSLTDALNATYDQFYASLPKFTFGTCLNYYLAPNEYAILS